MTSIEWLQEQLNPDMRTMQGNIIQGLLEEAKEMHKQEIIKFANDFWNWAKGGNFDISDAEQYYNETYESKGSDEHIVDTNEMISDEEIMIIPEAISILKIHQKWRLGADIVMIEPKELTKAIDILINYHINIMNEQLSFKKEISDEEIHEGIHNHCKIKHDRLCAEINAMVEGAKWYREQLKNKI